VKPAVDIFSALGKYNSTEEENYLTEAFVFLLKNLLVRERALGLEILDRLCIQDNDFSFQHGEAIEIESQKSILKGKDTPDITISSPNKRIYIEVKDYSRVELEQLRKYRADLDSCNLLFKRLILLTRFHVDPNEHKNIPDQRVHWFEVYNWLASLRVRESISEYLINSFKSFLEAKRMSIEKVGPDYLTGIHASNNLMSMVESAVENAKVDIDWKSAGWNFRGFVLGNEDYWCGIYFNNPAVLCFQMRKRAKFNLKILDKTTYEIRGDKRHDWFRLPLEETNFLSLDKDKQLEEIKKFIETAHKEAQLMKVK